jgi:menaquinone-specific isochorismate synthase
VACLKKVQERPLALYGFWNEQEGMLGATPELLFRQNEKGVETCAVAGTVTALQEWKNDSKLKEEHEIVVQAIVQALSPYGAVSVGEVGLTPFAHLAHLKTPILLSVTCPFETLVAALHPTPALGASPKEAGAIWLQQVQQLIDRRRYGAPVGLKKGSTGHCFVAIRNVQWTMQESQLMAGCGFVQGSDVELEWQELKMKLAAMKEILSL